MIEFLVDNIHVRFGGQLFWQMVGIPMGTNCAPLLADLFLYSYENELWDKLIKDSKRKVARKFNLSYRYIDDLISFNNKRFKEFISDIYPKELTISETIESTLFASYLDLLFIRDNSNNITTKLYDKRDTFGFHIVNFPFMSTGASEANWHWWGRKISWGSGGRCKLCQWHSNKSGENNFEHCLQIQE